MRLKKLTFRTELMLYSLGIIFFIVVTSFTALSKLKSSYLIINIQLKELAEIHSLSSQIDNLYNNIENYVHSDDEKYIVSYNTNFDEINDKIYRYQNSEKNKVIYYQYFDLNNMINYFYAKGNRIIDINKSKVETIYIKQLLDELNRIKGYIHNQVNIIVTNKLNKVESSSSNLGQEIYEKEWEFYQRIIFTVIFSLIFAYIFSLQISKPIHKLVKHLKKVGQCNFEIQNLNIKAQGELQILIDSFNFMTNKLRENIKLIYEKAEIEKKFQKEKIKNLEIETNLKQSQLNYLQSQINPHFLFNTLNSILVLSDIENANQTKMMIDNLSKLLRYNLRRANDLVKLKDECEVIKNYLYIQKVRFGNRINYVFDYEENCLQYKLPSMILQPFVENALIHGLEPKEGDGKLIVSIKDFKKYIDINIIDNGVGMSNEKLQSITKYNNKKIGIINVIKRLEIYFGKNVTTISSKIGEGTIVNIKLDP